MKIEKTLEFKFPDKINKTIKLQDDGSGAYIKIWDDSIGPLPDTDTINQWEQEYQNTPSSLKNIVNEKLWPWLDNKAFSKGYFNSAQCSALVTSSIASVKADAQAFNSWRDQVLLHVNQVYKDINNKVRTKPSLQELLAELPELTWP